MLIKIAGQEFDAEVIQKMIDGGMLSATKNDPASTTPTNAQLHGPLADASGNWGPFAEPGIRPTMLSAMQRPKSLSAVLPMTMSRNYNEKIAVMTGVTAEGGTNAANWCGNPPGPGALKKCTQWYAFGKYYVKDNLMKLADIGLSRDYSDVPRQILNAGRGGGPGATGNPFIPESVFMLEDTYSALRYQQYLIGVSAERDICHVAIQGNASLAYTASQHGWIAEFTGLDSQIKTGYVDHDSQLECPAADSVVETFNAVITGNNAAGNRTIVQVWQDTMFALESRADAAGLMGVNWVAVMRRDLFYALTQQVACNFYTARCTFSNNNAQNQDAAQIEGLRLAMLNGQYLLYNGMQVPVVFDECMPRETLGNQYYKSDIFVVPLTWQGMPLTYFQYFPMNNQYAQEFAQIMGSRVQYLNNGLWLVGERDTGLCLEHHYQMMPRVILEAPFLAGRIDDVFYNYYVQSHDAIPGESLYADGGISYWVGA